MLPKLLGDIIAAEHARLWRGSIRLALIMSLLGFAVMAVVVGMIFVLSGFYLALAETMKPWEAGVIVGGGVVSLATIMIMIIAVQGRSVPPQNNTLSEQSDNNSSAQLGSMIGDIVAKSNVKSSDIVLTALIGGIVLGASPRLRQQILATLSDLIKSTDK